MSAPEGKNVLVVSTVEDGGSSIQHHLGDGDVVKVVVPVVRQGFLDWLANDERAFEHAQEVADETAEQLPGESIDSRPGEADIDLAIRDALATFPADEIVVAIRQDDEQGLIESLATDGAPSRSVDGVPVRLVRVAD